MFFFGTEIGERKVGNYLEQDGLADGQTSLQEVLGRKREISPPRILPKTEELEVI